MRVATWCFTVVTAVLFAPRDAGAQIAPAPSPKPAPMVRNRLPWPRTVSEFDSLQSVAVPLFAPRVGAGVDPAPRAATGYTVYRSARRAVALPRTQCPMPVYPSGPVVPMPGATANGEPRSIDTAHVRGLLCENPLYRQRR